MGGGHQLVQSEGSSRFQSVGSSHRPIMGHRLLLVTIPDTSTQSEEKRRRELFVTQTYVTQSHKTSPSRNKTCPPRWKYNLWSFSKPVLMLKLWSNKDQHMTCYFAVLHLRNTKWVVSQCSIEFVKISIFNTLSSINSIIFFSYNSFMAFLP